MCEYLYSNLTSNKKKKKKSAIENVLSSQVKTGVGTGGGGIMLFSKQNGNDF